MPDNYYNYPQFFQLASNTYSQSSFANDQGAGPLIGITAVKTIFSAIPVAGSFLNTIMSLSAPKSESTTQQTADLFTDFQSMADIVLNSNIPLNKDQFFLFFLPYSVSFDAISQLQYSPFYNWQLNDPAGLAYDPDNGWYIDYTDSYNNGFYTLNDLVNSGNVHYDDDGNPYVVNDYLVGHPDSDSNWKTVFVGDQLGEYPHYPDNVPLFFLYPNSDRIYIFISAPVGLFGVDTGAFLSDFNLTITDLQSFFKKYSDSGAISLSSWNDILKNYYKSILTALPVGKVGATVPPVSTKTSTSTKPTTSIKPTASLTTTSKAKINSNNDYLYIILALAILTIAVVLHNNKSN